MVPYLSAWTFWREEQKDPDRLLQELLSQSSDTYQKCVNLAVEADQEAIAAAAEQLDKLNKQREKDYKEATKGKSLQGWSDYWNRDPPPPPPGPLERLPTPTAYDSECAGPLLKGCLLPAEPVSKVEEFTFQARTCQRPLQNCATLRQHIGELQQQWPAMRERKNRACRAGSDPGDCLYRYRQVVAVIEAISVHEITFERKCLQ